MNPLSDQHVSNWFWAVKLLVQKLFTSGLYKINDEFSFHVWCLALCQLSFCMLFLTKHIIHSVWLAGQVWSTLTDNLRYCVACNINQVIILHGNSLSNKYLCDILYIRTYPHIKSRINTCFRSLWIFLSAFLWLLKWFYIHSHYTQLEIHPPYGEHLSEGPFRPNGGFAGQTNGRTDRQQV